MRFKEYFNETTKHMEDKDLKQTLSKVPKSHAKLLRGYKFFTQGGNTLKNDDNHIGSNDLEHKKIVVAAPWWHSREFTMLHELGHLVWAKYVQHNPELIKKWKNLCKKTKGKVNQNAEEIFSHTYANLYTKNKLSKFDHPELTEFVKDISRL